MINQTPAAATGINRNLRKRVSSVVEYGLRFFSDFILTFTGLALLRQLFLPAAIISTSVSLLRFNRSALRSKPMFVIYWILIILTLDTASLISFLAVYSMSAFYLAIPATAYAAILILRRKTRFLHYMTPTQLLLLPIFLSGIMTVLPSLISIKTCEQSAHQPGVRMITKDYYKNIPLFIIDRPDRGDLVIADKINAFLRTTGIKTSIMSVDRSTGKKKIWLSRGQPLCMAEDPAAGDIFAIIAEPPARDSKKLLPPVSLLRYSPDGVLKHSADLMLPRSTYYIANLVFTGGRVLAVVEDEWRLYDKTSGRVIKSDTKKATRGSPVYFTAAHDDTLIATFTSGYLFLSLITGRRNMMKIDLKELRLKKAVSGSLFGFYDVKHIPGTDHFVAGHAWLHGGVIVDSNLNVVKKIRIPSGTRNIAVSDDGRTLFTGGYFDGYLYSMDLEKNKITGKIYVGKNIRGMSYTRRGTVLVGCDCGLVEVDAEVLR